MQIQQRVHLDCGFVLSEFGPGKQRKTQVDGGRVQRVQTLLQLHADRIRCIERPREADQNLCEVGVDAPVMRVIGVGQRGACHPAVKTHVVEFAAQRSQARFYIAKAIPVSELGKGHRQILIPTRKASRPCLSAVPSHTTAKLAIRQETQQLREHRAALVHEPLSITAKLALGASLRSNRGKAKYAANH